MGVLALDGGRTADVADALPPGSKVRPGPGDVVLVIDVPGGPAMPWPAPLKTRCSNGNR